MHLNMASIDLKVLEYWGMCDVSILEENGVEIPEDLKEQDELQANIWDL